MFSNISQTEARHVAKPRDKGQGNLPPGVVVKRNEYLLNGNPNGDTDLSIFTHSSLFR